MDALSIQQIKQRMENDQLSTVQIEQLRKDQRKGVQQIVRTYDRLLVKNKQLEKQFQQMTTYEKREWDKNNVYVAGVDEAGRGPLAGPVVAAAVILPQNFHIHGITDSKQLTELQRQTYYDIILKEAVSYGFAIVCNEEIDVINIYEATKKAMYKAIAKLHTQVDHVLIDAVPLENLDCPTTVLKKGDQKSITIAAASILAKVKRDRVMTEISEKFPQYGFATHKGYGTKHHLQMLETYGATPYHRQSFSPVQKVLQTD